MNTLAKVLWWVGWPVRLVILTVLVTFLTVMFPKDRKEIWRDIATPLLKGTIQ